MKPGLLINFNPKEKKKKTFAFDNTNRIIPFRKSRSIEKIIEIIQKIILDPSLSFWEYQAT